MKNNIIKRLIIATTLILPTYGADLNRDEVNLIQKGIVPLWNSIKTEALNNATRDKTKSITKAFQWIDGKYEIFVFLSEGKKPVNYITNGVMADVIFHAITDKNKLSSFKDYFLEKVNHSVHCRNQEVEHNGLDDNGKEFKEFVKEPVEINASSQLASASSFIFNAIQTKKTDILQMIGHTPESQEELRKKQEARQKEEDLRDEEQRKNAANAARQKAEAAENLRKARIINAAQEILAQSESQKAKIEKIANEVNFAKESIIKSQQEIDSHIKKLEDESSKADADMNRANANASFEAVKRVYEQLTNQADTAQKEYQSSLDEVTLIIDGINPAAHVVQEADTISNDTKMADGIKGIKKGAIALKDAMKDNYNIITNIFEEIKQKYEDAKALWATIKSKTGPDMDAIVKQVLGADTLNAGHFPNRASMIGFKAVDSAVLTNFVKGELSEEDLDKELSKIRSHPSVATTLRADLIAYKIKIDNLANSN